METGMSHKVDFEYYWPTYWFINGRAAPDTMAAPNAGWLPTQPYNSMPMMHPGERLLLRVVGGGRERPRHAEGPGPDPDLEEGGGGGAGRGVDLRRVEG